MSLQQLEKSVLIFLWFVWSTCRYLYIPDKISVIVLCDKYSVYNLATVARISETEVKTGCFSETLISQFVQLNCALLSGTGHSNMKCQKAIIASSPQSFLTKRYTQSVTISVSDFLGDCRKRHWIRFVKQQFLTILSLQGFFSFVCHLDRIK